MDEKKLAIIATKGTLDWAYPPFILASTAAALGYETEIFFTFYGLQLVKKDLDLKVSPLGNPGMPMPMGMDKWFPTLLTALPGMEAMMTSMMKKKMASSTASNSRAPRVSSISPATRTSACISEPFAASTKKPPNGRLRSMTNPGFWLGFVVSGPVSGGAACRGDFG